MRVRCGVRWGGAPCPLLRRRRGLVVVVSRGWEESLSCELAKADR